MATANIGEDLLNHINSLPAELLWGHIFPLILPEDVYFQMRIGQKYGSKRLQPFVSYAVHIYDLEINNDNTEVRSLAPLVPFLPGNRRKYLVAKLLRGGIHYLRPEITTHILMVINKKQLALACTRLCATGRVFVLLRSRSLVERFNANQRQVIFEAILASLRKISDYGIVLNLLLSFDLWDKNTQRWLRDGILSAYCYPLTPKKRSCNLEQSFQSAIMYMDLNHFSMICKLLSLDSVKDATAQNKLIQQLVDMDYMTETSLVSLLNETTQNPDSF